MNVPQEEVIRTRCGYTPNESIRAFDKAMIESGVIGTGKCLHFAADIVTSGGFDSLIRSVWDYAISHVGIASPRIFVYLKKRIEEIHDILRRLPDEAAYSSEEFQVRVGEIIIVIRDAPTKTLVGWPKVGTETHTEGWIRAIAGAPETAVLRKVWRPEGDSSILRTVGAELCKAIFLNRSACALAVRAQTRARTRPPRAAVSRAPSAHTRARTHTRAHTHTSSHTRTPRACPP